MGRARGDPLARHPGGREGRHLLARLLRPAVLRPDRPGRPDGHGGAVLGRRGHRPVDRRHRPRRHRRPRQRHRGADRHLDPADVRHARRGEGGGLLLLRAGRRIRRRRDAHARRLRPGQGRVGAERHQDLGHQRRHRQCPHRRRRRRPGARHQGARLLHRAAEHPGPVPGPEVQEARHPRLPHRRGGPGGRPRPRLLPAGRQGQAGRAPRPGPGEGRGGRW